MRAVDKIAEMNRATFEQTGIVDWRRLPLGLLFQLGPVLLLGGLLGALAWVGYYIVILMPIISVIIPALLSAAIANWMRWRELRVAGTVGFVLGVIAYLSQYYLVVAVVGLLAGAWDAPFRLDLVPPLIWNTMNTMTIGDDPPNATRNWAFLIGESAIVGAAFALAHVEAAKALYCPVCGAGLKKKSSILPPYFATALAEGVHNKDLTDLPQDESGGEIEGDAWSNVEVLYCFHGQTGAEPVFYMTLNETRFEDGVGFKSTVLDKVLLSADEMVLIGEKCPGLAVGPSLPTTPPSESAKG